MALVTTMVSKNIDKIQLKISEISKYVTFYHLNGMCGFPENSSDHLDYRYLINRISIENFLFNLSD